VIQTDCEQRMTEILPGHGLIERQNRLRKADLSLAVPFASLRDPIGISETSFTTKKSRRSQSSSTTSNLSSLIQYDAALIDYFSIWYQLTRRFSEDASETCTRGWCWCGWDDLCRWVGTTSRSVRGHSHRWVRRVSSLGYGCANKDVAVDAQGYCGGQAFSIPIDKERFGVEWMNQGVQGGSYIYQ